jgi:hypothetical protein
MIADPGMDHEAVEAVFAARREEILAVANMMHLKIVNLPGAMRRRHLTQRQREALEWVADGKTMQDIADADGGIARHGGEAPASCARGAGCGDDGAGGGEGRAAEPDFPAGGGRYRIRTTCGRGKVGNPYFLNAGVKGR